MPRSSLTCRQLGAYGFLAGTTTEKEGVPNAGFWDQRAVLEWIQKYIHLVGGDKKAVTAMGISAGAGSILHHLVFEGGTLDPLFSRAILQSPGYTNYLDRKGQLQGNYKRFEDIAGCKDKGLACLRRLDEAALKVASDKANGGQRQGTFAFGPAPDGKLIVDTPTLEFGRGWSPYFPLYAKADFGIQGDIGKTLNPSLAPTSRMKEARSPMQRSTPTKSSTLFFQTRMETAAR